MLKVILGDLMDEKSLAEFALKHLDYTLLDAEADEKQITEFLERASRWKPAAVCVLPSEVSRAKETLDPQIIVASAAGCFPNPNGDINQRIDDIKTAVEGGADEIDIVMDFEAMMDLRPGDARSTLEQLIDECKGLTVKVILETSCLDLEEIENAARIAIDCGADFIKSSTGRRGGCTPLVAEILAEIAQEHGEVGIKISGGIRTLQDLQNHLDSMENATQVTSLGPKRFRIGASSLLNSIEKILEK
jgi:deoxyribose-phosphate aldolase